MATLLDTSLIDFLLPLFVFLFIFIVIYALLAKTSLFGDKMPALNFLAAICIAAVAVFAGNLVKLVGSITPWIVFIIIILVLIFGMYRFFGVKDKEVWDSIGGVTVVSIIIIIIVFIALVTVFESQITPYGNETSGGTVRNAVIQTITHPRLLGALFILVTAAITVKLLADKLED